MYAQLYLYLYVCVLCVYGIGFHVAARLWSWCSLGWLLLSGLAQAEVGLELELKWAGKWFVNNIKF